MNSDPKMYANHITKFSILSLNHLLVVQNLALAGSSKPGLYSLASNANMTTNIILASDSLTTFPLFNMVEIRKLGTIKMPGLKQILWPQDS